jgi:hypothetical protein
MSSDVPEVGTLLFAMFSFSELTVNPQETSSLASKVGLQPR